MSDKFGTDPFKLHRRDAPDTSVAAAHTVDTQTDEATVFRLLCRYPRGLTVKEIALMMGKDSINQVSGRLSALAQKNMIEDSGNRRNKCRVMVVKDVTE